MKNQINKLLGKRSALADELHKIQDAAEADNRVTLNADEETKYQNIETEISSIEAQIKRLEKLDSLDQQINAVPNSPIKPNIDGNPLNRRATEEYHNLFFNQFARKPKERVGAEVFNALEAGTDSEGGYLVPEEWARELIRDLPELVVMRKYATTIVTASDRNLPVQTSRGAFTWIDEEGAYSTNDPAFNNLVLSAYKLGGTILVSDELLQDNTYDLAGNLRQDASEEFADKEEDAFMSGDNSGKPEGIFVATAVAGVSITGTTGAVSATPVVTFDNLIDTFYGLGARYRRNATWLASDGHAKLVRKLKDSDGQYLWQASTQAGQPDLLLGKPFETSDSAPAPATASRGICFGDWKHYIIVDRLDMQMKRLDELYAANGQVGFRFTKRLDGGMTQANAMTYYAHGAAS